MVPGPVDPYETSVALDSLSYCITQTGTFVLNDLFSILFERQRGGSYILTFSPKYPQHLRLGHADIMCAELGLGLLCGWQRLTFLSCSPGCVLAGNWNQEQSWDLNLGTWLWDASVPSGVLIARSNICLRLNTCPRNFIYLFIFDL